MQASKKPIMTLYELLLSLPAGLLSIRTLGPTDMIVVSVMCPPRLFESRQGEVLIRLVIRNSLTVLCMWCLSLLVGSFTRVGLKVILLFIAV